ncbi:MAG: OmpA family protein [Lutibacter sp.]|uniref:OmpA family protein n=1 Tax=Lutibacter sp. TaxID=1925666 RepID=UPI0017F3880A|nr:OmpA family protein [Lutibacter sp.]MBT8317756.1 OmpA family protein [Lutibacter sp.]NNJ58614.1 OmpA family protein [Lutibacter sp.]
MKKITLIILLFCAGYINAQDVNYRIKNISENTKLADFGVAYYGENEAVFASSRKDKSIRNRKWYLNKQPYLELFKGTLAEEGEINNVERFSETINTKYHESNVTFTKDLKTVYFSRDNYINKKTNKDDEGWVLIQLYKATVGDNGEWTNIEPMPFNSDNYQTGHPVLNFQENKLYFTSDMPGSLGSTDIFVVDIYSDGTFGEPVNLGPNVNTRRKEMFPFIDDNNVLYFSSNGYHEEAKGQLDVYATKIIGKEAIEPAINLGYPINSKSDDFAFVKKSGKNWGHFSSNREGGKGDDDIYYFEEIAPDERDCNQLVEGVVREKETGALMPGALVVLYGEDGEKIESVIADKYASFTFKLDCKTPYKVVGSKQNYDKDSEEFETSDVRDLELAIGLTLTPSEFIVVRGKLMVNINPIYFDLDKSNIRDDAAIELEKVLRIMQKYPKIKIDLGSHTDSRAPDLYNVKLSERRAQSSLNWIIEKGIDPSRITGKGYGETQLVNKCANGVKCTEEEHQLNRRTEFVILNPEAVDE